MPLQTVRHKNTKDTFTAVAAVTAAMHAPETVTCATCMRVFSTAWVRRLRSKRDSETHARLPGNLVECNEGPFAFEGQQLVACRKTCAAECTVCGCTTAKVFLDVYGVCHACVGAEPPTNDPFHLEDDDVIALAINADPAFVLFTKVEALPPQARDALVECLKTKFSHYSCEPRLYHSMIKYNDFVSFAARRGLSWAMFKRFLNELTASWEYPQIASQMMRRPRLHLSGVPMTTFMRTHVYNSTIRR